MMNKEKTAMNFTYENQGTNVYLVYEISDSDIMDSMSLGMLTNNKINGLSPAIFTQMDSTKYIKYNISAKISVKQFFSGQVNKKRLLGVFTGIVDAMLSAEDYMLDSNSIILDLDYIFSDVSTCETILICLPLENSVRQDTELGMFFKNIMFNTQFDQTENCDYVAQIINHLNSSQVFSLVNFKELLEKIKHDNKSEEVVETSTAQPVNVNSVPQQSQPVNVNSAPQQSQPVVNRTSAPNVTIAQSVSVPQQQKIVQQSVKSSQRPTNIPQQQASPQQQQQLNMDNTKKITMMGLLMHYSKENAELYKAQKQAKKANKGQSVKTETKPVTQSHPVKGNVTNVGFAIPGQDVPVGSSTSKPMSQMKDTVRPQMPVTNSAPNTIPNTIPNTVSNHKTQLNFGDTTVLGGSAVGETTVLNGGAQTAVVQSPYLIRLKNNEKITLDKPVFRIGKERSYVDYFIGDNTAISRSHANVISRDGQFYVVDTNSTNHTFINGIMLQSNVEKNISSGDVIRLANEDFEFRLH